MSGRAPAAPPRTALWNGSDRPLPERIALRAGPIDLDFESGELRRFRIGDREVLRRIYAAVRDRNWGTVRPRISNVRCAAGDDSFELSFDVECREREIDFAWTGRAQGGPDGTVRFSFDGEARSAFLRNRIGFCVLHPILECAGARVRVMGPDGSMNEGAFPREVSPEAPFQEIASLAHEAAPGLWVELRFEGDLFEMEDQRNWLDGSFKTFSTPLRIPYPVQVTAGTRISQAVVLSLKGPSPPRRAPPAHGSAFVCEAPRGGWRTLPAIGLGMASHGRPLDPVEVERLRALRLSHLRVDLRLSSESSLEALARASGEARALGTKLEAALFLEEDPERELARLAGAVRELAPPVLTWLVFHAREKATTARWARLARERLGGLIPGARFGGGTDNDFAEVNRDRPPLEELDLVSFAYNPQVHLFDDSTLVESLEAEGHALASLKAFSGGLLLAVSPVTFRPRFPVNATGPVATPVPGELPFEVDPRQMSLFGAAWTLASIGRFAEAGASSLTCFETTGWKGVMETRAGSPVPGKFHSIPGGVFPLYHALLDLGEHAGSRIAPAASSAPSRVAAFGLEGPGGRTLLLANLAPERAEVEARGLPGEVRVRFLDETNALEAMADPGVHRGRREPRRTRDGSLRLEPLPFGLARIDGAGAP